MGRAPCCSKVGLNRGPWTTEEDMLLSKYIEANGEGNWRALPKAAGLLRCGKSCRLRWVNYLRPNVKRGNISEDEEDLIIMLHALLGNRWSLIAARMPGRTDNEIKNYWNTHLSKKLASRGLDPKTHKPIINNTSKQTTSDRTKVCGESNSDAEEMPHEAWETTMDMDTCSFSTGSCSSSIEDNSNAGHDYRVKQSKKELKPNGKIMPPALLVKKGRCSSSMHKYGTSSYNCPSPSSVLNNIYSPAASASNCDSPSSGTPVSQSTGNNGCELNSSNTTDGSPHQHDDSDNFLRKDNLCSGAEQQTIATSADIQMLDYFDEFLCSNKHEEGDALVAVAEKEELLAGSEFWESLGKIEFAEVSLCQSDLWDGLTDLITTPTQDGAVFNQLITTTSCQGYQESFNSVF